MSAASAHESVLLQECIDGLNIQPGGHYIDGTFGRGGHSRAILSCLGEQGSLLGLDKDPDAIREGMQLQQQDARFTIHQASFARMHEIAGQLNLAGRVDGILLDLGVSSPQLDEAHRGFSFRQDGPLDMRMDPEQGISAAEWLASAKETEIARVLKEYGEEKFAKRIAKAIIRAREETPINTTGQLASIVAAANPAWEKGKDPATRSFQAIRIFINQELEDLQTCLEHVVELLAPGGRLVVISFHSLEDRMIKRFIRQQSKGDDFPPDLPVTHVQLNPKLRAIGKKIQAGKDEVIRNPRSRSAVLRIAEKLS